MDRNIIFIIPAFNEAANLPHLLTSLCRVERFLDIPIRIILVDDGSTDNTEEVIRCFQEKMIIYTIKHPLNFGPGTAFRNGLIYALEIAMKDDIIVTIEADNTSDLCILGRMIERLDRGSDIVLASVYGQGRIVGTNFFRRFLSFWANSLMKITLRIPGIHTFTSFFRVYRFNALQQLKEFYGDHMIEESGFTCMLEMLIKSKLLELKITEVPMLLDGNIRLGGSKMKIIRNTQSTLAILHKYLFQNAYRPFTSIKSTTNLFD